jgi:soluble lytic murein transglycosylase-like protein
VSRPLLATLCAATLSALSCAFSAPAPLPAPEPVAALPSVEAGPPSGTAARPAPLDAEVAEVASYLATKNTGLSRRETDVLASAIFEESRRHDLDPHLVLAVMHVESRFNAFALSPVGAMGLMQVMPATGEELAADLGIAWHGPQTLFDPMLNLRMGVAYLKQLESRYGNIATALAAYNWGPGHIDRRLRRGRELPTEYSRLVLDAHAGRAGRAS